MDPEYDGMTEDLFEGEEETRERKTRLVSEFVRRAIDNAVGQVQSSGSLSREALGFLIQHGDRGRKEVVRLVAKEVGDFLRATDLSSEVIKVLTNVRMDVSVSFRKNDDGGVDPVVQQSTEVDGEPLDFHDDAENTD